MGENYLYKGKGTQCGPTICSPTRVSRYLQHACSGFMTYVLDNREEGKKSIDDVPVVREYRDVFLEDFPSVPPERQVKFLIDLVPGSDPISKAPYRLVPYEM